MATQTDLSKIKKGEYFRFTGKKKVYTYDGRSGGAFTYTPYNDFCDQKRTKTNRSIEIDFYFSTEGIAENEQ